MQKFINKDELKLQEMQKHTKRLMDNILGANQRLTPQNLSRKSFLSSEVSFRVGHSRFSDSITKESLPSVGDNLLSPLYKPSQVTKNQNSPLVSKQLLSHPKLRRKNKQVKLSINSKLIKIAAKAKLTDQPRTVFKADDTRNHEISKFGKIEDMRDKFTQGLYSFQKSYNSKF